MDTVKLDEYLRSPCMASSLPYWKAQKTVIPDNTRHFLRWRIMVLCP